MKVITEERLRLLLDSEKWYYFNMAVRRLLTNELEEIDTLIPKETDLILAAEKYASKYNGDDRQDIKTDVLNAFYHGADFKRKNK